MATLIDELREDVMMEIEAIKSRPVFDWNSEENLWLMEDRLWTEIQSIKRAADRSPRAVWPIIDEWTLASVKRMVMETDEWQQLWAQSEESVDIWAEMDMLWEEIESLQIVKTEVKGLDNLREALE